MTAAPEVLVRVKPWEFGKILVRAEDPLAAIAGAAFSPASFGT
jgi:hypothetical protein